MTEEEILRQADRHLYIYWTERENVKKLQTAMDGYAKEMEEYSERHFRIE
jgi:hypothetical protein